jgi:lactate dehydrogenase-like 2-hydroxyacid dehydrogenase
VPSTVKVIAIYSFGYDHIDDVSAASPFDNTPDIISVAQ